MVLSPWLEWGGDLLSIKWTARTFTSGTTVCVHDALVLFMVRRWLRALNSFRPYVVTISCIFLENDVRHQNVAQNVPNILYLKTFLGSVIQLMQTEVGVQILIFKKNPGLCLLISFCWEEPEKIKTKQPKSNLE